MRIDGKYLVYIMIPSKVLFCTFFSIFIKILNICMALFIHISSASSVPSYIKSILFLLSINHIIFDKNKYKTFEFPLMWKCIQQFNLDIVTESQKNCIFARVRQVMLMILNQSNVKKAATETHSKWSLFKIAIYALSILWIIYEIMKFL